MTTTRTTLQALRNAESNLSYVEYHAYGKLDGAECQSLAQALADVRRAIRALEPTPVRDSEPHTYADDNRPDYGAPFSN